MNLNASTEWTPAFEIVMLFSGALILNGPALTGGNDKNIRRKLSVAGKYIFALSLFVFAAEHFLFAGFVISIIPDWIPWRVFWAYFVMCAFLAASVSLFIQKLVRLSETLLSLMFFLWVCMLHVPLIVANIYVESAWTNLFIPLAMSGIGLLIAGSTMPEPKPGAKI